jgi:hypothetical protein
MSSEPQSYKESPQPSEWNAQTSHSNAQASASHARTRLPLAGSAPLPDCVDRDLLDGVDAAQRAANAQDVVDGTCAAERARFSAAIAKEIVDGIAVARAGGLVCELPAEFTLALGSEAPQTVKITD